MLKLRELVLIWDNLYPVDLWWRRRHSIPFGARNHLDMSYISMVFEYIEWVELLKAEYDERTNSTGINKVEDKDIVHMSQKEIRDEFDKLDLSSYANITAKN